MTSDDLTAIRQRSREWAVAYGNELQGYGRAAPELRRQHEADFDALLRDAEAAGAALDGVINAHQDATDALAAQGRMTAAVLAGWDAWEQAGLMGPPPSELLQALDALRPVVPVTPVPVVLPQPISVGW